MYVCMYMRTETEDNQEKETSWDSLCLEETDDRRERWAEGETGGEGGSGTPRVQERGFSNVVSTRWLLTTDVHVFHETTTQWVLESKRQTRKEVVKEETFRHRSFFPVGFLDFEFRTLQIQKTGKNEICFFLLFPFSTTSSFPKTLFSDLRPDFSSDP